jgi:hypothetical protein
MPISRFISDLCGSSAGDENGPCVTRPIADLIAVEVLDQLHAVAFAKAVDVGLLPAGHRHIAELNMNICFELL